MKDIIKVTIPPTEEVIYPDAVEINFFNIDKDLHYTTKIYSEQYWRKTKKSRIKKRVTLYGITTVEQAKRHGIFILRNWAFLVK